LFPIWNTYNNTRIAGRKRNMKQLKTDVHRVKRHGKGLPFMAKRKGTFWAAGHQTTSRRLSCMQRLR
jgi:hypothetical protein